MLFLVFIVYTNKETDPKRSEILFLSDLLCNNGVDCTIDQYHRSDHSISDWSKWVENKITYCISQKGCVLLECSLAMYASLEIAESNCPIEMEVARIDCFVLRQLIRETPEVFIPFYIDDTSLDFTPRLLSGKTIYRFPINQLFKSHCDHLEQIAQESILDVEVFVSPDFDSLRSLWATLTKQQETPQPKIGKPQQQTPQQKYSKPCKKWFMLYNYSCLHLNACIYVCQYISIT